MYTFPLELSKPMVFMLLVIRMLSSDTTEQTPTYMNGYGVVICSNYASLTQSTKVILLSWPRRNFDRESLKQKLSS